MKRFQKKNHYFNQRGFSLMEMLVAVTIFSMLIVTATNIFLLASRSQRKVFDMESMQAGARFTLEAMTREIRTGLIDYDYYADRDLALQTPEKVLALVDSEEMLLKFYESDESNEDNCPDEASRPCLLIEVGDYEPFSLSPKGSKVQSVDFFISPEQDPFSFDPAISGYAADVQPSVTILLALESVGRRFDERSFLSLQTTVASRKYVR
ncbi:prepilin-type N-terminal cleavage/methylation domain-containing protein [Patescibacteria group bacterium]|nr:prepilin-type N-terminal cleavage/methylation domain-containing protein [Patescibacteria group bacterium]MBU1029455.1 prepilin-type N-terminal cleavage/methylation domain-containing protein [Patescibacteria group bacterium]MBU1916049.1 prepilin-type N-terminal cleavage/methylation domain-containing protein [Patescibacteria group bacterium]